MSITRAGGRMRARACIMCHEADEHTLRKKKMSHSFQKEGLRNQGNEIQKSEKEQFLKEKLTG